MSGWDNFQLKDGPQGHSPVLDHPDFATAWEHTDPALALYRPQNSDAQVASQQQQQQVQQPGGDAQTQQPQAQRTSDTMRYAPTDNRPQGPMGPLDQVAQSHVQNGKLEFSYGDPNFDRILSKAQNYQVIQIDNVPANIEPKHWLDKDGHYFWFPGGADGNTKHYYPTFAKAITVNGKTIDLEAQRLKVDDAYAKTISGNSPDTGFQSWTKNTDTTAYFTRMSGMSAEALKTLETSLKGSVATSSNPYFKIYLADVYTAEAMQPIIDQVKRTGTASANNPETLGKLDQAIALVKAAQVDSRSGLGRTNFNPPGNVMMPMDPYEIYQNPNNTDFYNGFWGGSFDQSAHREMALTTIRNLISNNALPRFELP